jgi:hypothetical protein
MTSAAAPVPEGAVPDQLPVVDQLPSAPPLTQ